MQPSVSFLVNMNTKMPTISNGMNDKTKCVRRPSSTSKSTVFPVSYQYTQQPRFARHRGPCARKLLASSSGSGGSSNNSEDGATNPFYEGMSPYEILGVSSTAEPSAITAAFQALVSKWGPGAVQSTDDAALKKEAGLRMQKIYKAYYILDDAERRKLYDTHGESGVTSKKTEKTEKSEVALLNGKPLTLPPRSVTADPSGSSASDNDDEEGVSGEDIMRSLTGTGGISDIFDLFFGGSGSSTKGDGSIRSLFGGGRSDRDEETDEEGRAGLGSIVTGPRSRMAPRKGTQDRNRETRVYS